MFWHLHFGWDYTLAEQSFLNSGCAPTGPINWFTYVRPSFVAGWRF